MIKKIYNGRVIKAGSNLRGMQRVFASPLYPLGHEHCGL